MDDFVYMNGDCLKELGKVPDNSVSFIFADLPYDQNYSIEL